LTAVTDATGQAIRYEYDDKARLVGETNRTGGKYYMVWNAMGRCVEIGGHAGYRLQKLRYSDSERKTEVTDALGGVHVFHWDESGQVVTTVSPKGAVESTAYDEFGRAVADTDAVGRTATYSYDAAGNRSGVTTHTGVTLKIDFNHLHLPIRLITPDSAEWKWEYDARGGLTAFQNPVGGRWTYDRREDGLVTFASTPSGQRIEYRYGPHVSDIAITDQIGAVRRVFDRFGNITADFDLEGLLRSYRYDALGRLTAVVESDGAETIEVLNEIGLVIESRTATGATTRYRYSSYGDLLERINPDASVAKWRYDLEGRVIAIENENGDWYGFEFDPDGDIIAERRFDGTILRYELDPAGQVLKTQNPDGSTFEYTRDGAGNITKISYSDGAAETFAYDWSGQIVASANSHGHSEFEYDLAGRLTAETQNGRRIQYNLSPEGFLLRQHLDRGPTGGLDFSYDLRGRLITAAAGGRQFATYKYDALDRLVERRLAGASERFRFDQRRRVGEQIISRGPRETLLTRRFAYDAADNLTAVEDSLHGSSAYTYDGCDRLVSVTSARGSEDFAYDAAGNLRTRGGSRLEYTPGNRLVRAYGRVYEYDANGNITAIVEGSRITRLSWTTGGRLHSVSHSDGSTTWFAYDAFGRRISKQHGGDTIEYLWAKNDLAGEEAGERTEYLIAHGYPMALWCEGHRYDVMTSHVALPWELLEDGRRLGWSASFDPFGSVVDQGKPGRDPKLRLPGQYADSETGLHYNLERYYEPLTGRFISPDPLQLRGGFNAYAYGPNHINWTDPFGLKCGKQHQYITYVVREPPGPGGTVIYVGRASGPHGMTPQQVLLSRQSTHRSSHPSRANWQLELDRGSLTYAQARGREQNLFTAHGGQARPRGVDPHAPGASNPNNSKLFNIDPPISARDPEKRQGYLSAATGL
jgi:RHS repeat-associated protein